MSSDLVIWIGLTLVGTAGGLLHVALAIRALRRSVALGIVSLVVPLAAPVVAHRTGAPRAAFTYGGFLVVYAVLGALAS